MPPQRILLHIESLVSLSLSLSLSHSLSILLSVHGDGLGEVARFVRVDAPENDLIMR
jgi:hypothetical protein